MMFAKACDKLPLLQCQTNATAMLEAMRSVSFDGKSGPVKLDDNEDLIPGSVAFTNYWLQTSVSFICFFLACSGQKLQVHQTLTGLIYFCLAKHSSSMDG